MIFGIAHSEWDTTKTPSHNGPMGQWANGMVFVASPNCHHNLINSHWYSHETMENQRIYVR
jgi:hypothetical protein